MYPMSDTTNVCHHRFLSLNYRDYVVLLGTRLYLTNVLFCYKCSTLNKKILLVQSETDMISSSSLSFLAEVTCSRCDIVARKKRLFPFNYRNLLPWNQFGDERWEVLLNRRRKGIRLLPGLMTIYLVKAWQQHLLRGLFLCFMPSAYFRFQAKHVLVPKERSMPQHEGEIENPYSPTAEHIIFVFSRKILTRILFVASFAIQSGKKLCQQQL